MRIQAASECDRLGQWQVRGIPFQKRPAAPGNSSDPPLLDTSLTKAMASLTARTPHVHYQSS